MNNNNTLKTKRTLVSLMLIAAFHQNALAQEQEPDGADTSKLETITVTSQKRSQSLREVPISVTAMTGDYIQKAGIERMETLANYIPNFTIAKDSIADRINIRGMQSGNQAGFEQSVGTFVNGIYRGRGAQSRFSFLDVERVEVLRGPQSILFGKNTVAGALNITTAKPDEDFNGRVMVAYNPTFDQTEFNGMLTGSLTDDLRARVFILDRNMEEGWVENVFYDTDNPESDEQMARLTMEWDVTDSTMITLMYETSDFDFASFPHGTRVAGPLAALGAIEGTDITSIGNTNPVLNFGSSQQMIGEADEFAIISETLFDSGTLTITLGHSAYDFERSTDVDYSPLDGLRFNDSEDFSQDSAEIRFASDRKGNIEYMTGLYWQQQDITLDGLSLFNIPVLQQVLFGGCANGAAALGANLDDIYVAGDVGATGAGIIAAGGPAALVNACGTAAAFDGIPTGVGRYALLEQETDTLGIFAQATYHFSDDLRTTFGLRYTQEEKAASKIGYATDFTPNNKVQTNSPLVQAVSEQVGEFQTHDFNPSDPGMTRDENSPDWSVNVQYDVDSQSMAYVSAGTGFKSGGYNSFYMRSPDAGNQAVSSDVQFEDETVLSFELGYKTRFLDGAADFNIAAFHSSFEDLQVAIFSGNTTFEVQNAAQATSYGLEMDARWRATDSLTVTGALGLLNFEYDDFPNQACTSNQFLDERQRLFAASAGNIPGQIGIAMGYNNAACAASGINDMSGRPSSNAPDLTASLILSHVATFGDYDLLTNFDMNYHSEVYRVDDLDPIGKESANLFANLSVTFEHVEMGWALGLVVNNIGDVDSFHYINDVPLFAGAHNYMPLAGRNFLLRATYSFGQ